MGSGPRQPPGERRPNGLGRVGGGQDDPLAAQRICEHRAAAIVAAVENLKNGPLDPLLDLLSRPAGNDIVELEAIRHTVG